MAALSYDGNFTASVHGDESLTDLPLIVDGMADAFAAYRQAAAAGVHLPSGSG